MKEESGRAAVWDHAAETGMQGPNGRFRFQPPGKVMPPDIESYFIILNSKAQQPRDSYVKQVVQKTHQ